MNIFSILIPKHTLTYLNANDPLDQAVAFLLGATYTAIPVVDDQGRYVGIASEGDFLRAVMEHGRENLAKYKVADIVPSRSKNTYLYISVLQVQNDTLSCDNADKAIPVIYHAEEIPIQNPFHNLIFFYSI